MLPSRYRAAGSRSRRLAIESLENRFLLAAGTLDPSFGVNGIVEDVVSVASDSNDTVVEAFQDQSGRIIVAGRSYNGHGQVAALARYTNDGEIDSTYGQNGTVTSPLAADHTDVRAAAITPDGNVLLTGYAGTPSTVAQILPDGTVDPNFGDDGYIEAIPDGGRSTAIVVAPNGDFVVAGESYQAFHLSRFTSQGNFVRIFGNLGTATSTAGLTSVDVKDVIFLSDGSLVVAASVEASDTQVDLLVARYDANGSWDESFGTDGFSRIPVALGRNYFYGRATLGETSDGKIVVATSRETEREDGNNSIDFLIVKLNADGSQDVGFGVAGEVELRFGGGNNSRLVDMKTQPDDTLLVAGFVKLNSRDRLIVAKLNADGSFVTGFANGGVLDERLYSSFDTSNGSLIPLPNGETLFAFTSSQDFVFAKLNVAGRIDTTFDQHGYSSTNLSTVLGATNLGSTALLPDGRLLVLEHSAGFRDLAPNSYLDHALRRYWADGTLDENYGEQGRFSVSEHGYALSRYSFFSQIVPGDNEFFVVLNTFEMVAIARLDNTGELDTSFGESGWITFDHTEFFSYVNTVVSWRDAGFLLIGVPQGGESYVGIRLRRDGTLDPTFADQGTWRIPKTPFRGGDGVDVCLHPDDSITALIANPASGERYALQRWLADGTLDPQFGDAGQVATPLSTNYVFGNSQLVCSPDGGFLFASRVYDVDERHIYPVLLARYDSAGVLDSSFGTDGIVTLRVGVVGASLANIEVDSQGRFIVGMTATNSTLDFAVVRLNANGELDTTFGESGLRQLDLHGLGDTLTTTLVDKNGDVLLGGNTKTGTETRLAIVRIAGDRSGPSPWQNQQLPADANADGQVTPIDPLRILNEINRNLARALPPYRDIRIHKDFLDTNGDGFVTPADVRVSINVLNQVSVSGEGEGTIASVVVAPNLTFNESFVTDANVTLDAIASGSVPIGNPSSPRRAQPRVDPNGVELKFRGVLPATRIHTVLDGSNVDRALLEIEIFEEFDRFHDFAAKGLPEQTE